MASTDFFSSGDSKTLVRPASVATGGAPVAIEIDTKGYRWGIILIELGAVGATGTGAGVGALTVQEGNTSGGTFTDIPGAAFSIAIDADNSTLVGVIDLHRFGRYMQLDGVVGTGGATLMGSTMILYGNTNTAEYATLANARKVFEVLA